MASGIVAIIGGILALVSQLLTEYYKGAPERKRKADALADIELKETQAAMAAVDAELDGVQPPKREPLLLSTDDHL